MVQAEHVANAIRRRARRPGQHLRVFWVTLLDEDRDTFAGRLKGVRSVVPCVLRDDIGDVFKNPDMVARDVTSVLGKVRGEIDGDVGRRFGDGVDLVVISRKELGISNTSSPVPLPQWFPVGCGQISQIDIDNLTWTADATLSDHTLSLSLANLQRILHDIDGATVRRLVGTLEADPRSPDVRGVMDTRTSTTVEDRRSALGGIERRLRTIRNPADFRPSRSKGQTIVEKLGRKADQTSPQRTAGHGRDVGGRVATSYWYRM